jgi:LysR family hca operon transcriptional activator
VELRHLRYFTAVAAHGSFNRAAQLLHLTQPALSRQVKDLEDEIGVPLLVRGTNAVKLTAVGEAFYEDARDVLARADHAIQRARGAKGKAVVRVGYLAAAVYELMANALDDFRELAPQVSVELIDLLPAEMSAAAQEEKVDMLMLPDGDVHLVPGFEWSELLRISPVLVMPEAHPLAKLKKIPPARLQGVALIGLGKESYPGYAASMRTNLRAFGVTPRFVALIDDGLPSLFTALQVNRAATILGDAVENTLPRNLVMRPFSPALPRWPLMIGLPETKPNAHAVRFVKILRETADRLKKPKRR